MVRVELRATFGTVPELYDRARPTYPSELIADLRALTAGDRLLEIGCGTGKATRALVAAGFDVTCVELSDELAALARRNVPGARVEVADVEQWQGGPFDVVAAFTAFHWLVDGFGTAARLLSEGGSLAVVKTVHVLGDDAFFVEAQEDYDAVVPSPDNQPPPRPNEIEELELAAPFDRVAERRYLREIEYTPDAFIAVLSTYSGNIALPAAQREELFRRLHARASAQGTVRKLYVFALTVARKR
jgi:SAM-dependent methyltransferase